MKINKSLILPLALLVTAPVASASAVLIDFGTTSVTGWNNVAAQTSAGDVELTGLKDTNGNGNYGFSIIGGGNFSTTSIAPNDTFASGTFDGVVGTALDEMQATIGLASAIPSTVYNDHLSNGGFTDHTVTISGLTAGGKYVIYYIGGTGRTDSATTQGGISLQAGFSDVDTTADYYITNSTTGAYQQPATLTTSILMPRTYIGLVKYDNVIADTGGNINLNLRGGRAAINAFAFAPVPEPSSAALLGLGGLALILRRRK